MPLISRSLPPKKIEYKKGEMQLLFRPFEADDARKFQDVLKDTLPALYKYMLWPEQDWNFEECLRWTIQRHGEYFLGIEFEWGCFNLLTGELLGAVGIMPAFSFNPDCYEIGYWISQKHTNKGLATLCTQVITLASFKCLGVKRLQVGSASANQASIRVIEKCGFKYEGELRGLFPPPSEEKIKRGTLYCETDYLYALLYNDCEKLNWYEDVQKSSSIFSLDGENVLFSELPVKI